MSVKNDQDENEGLPVNRREFVKAFGIGVATAEVLTGTVEIAEAKDNSTVGSRSDVTYPIRKIAFSVNGTKVDLVVEPRWTLAFVLREKLRLTGTKIGCDQGACGFCTVILEGREIYSCNILAVDVAEKSVVTIEGLSNGSLYEELHPVQKKFLDHMAFQCAFCTSGHIVTASTLVDSGRKDIDLEKVRWHQRGVLCRCGSYPKIFKAILEAAAIGKYLDPEKIA